MPHYATPLTNPNEIAVWESILQYQNTEFTTSGRGSTPGLPFTYVIKGAEMFVDRREKSITRATVMKAYHRAIELGEVTGPKQLDVFGASYLFPILKKIGVCR